MELSGLLSLLRELPAYKSLLEEMRHGDGEGSLSLLRAARPYVVATLVEDLGWPAVLVMSRPDLVSGAVDQLRRWLPHPERVLRFAEPEALPYERIPWAAETVRERLGALSSLVRWQQGDDRAPVVVTSARALMQRTLPRREFALNVRRLQVGQRLVLSRVLGAWLELGYEMVSVVESPGSFSRRGGIVALSQEKCIISSSALFLQVLRCLLWVFQAF